VSNPLESKRPELSLIGVEAIPRAGELDEGIITGPRWFCLVPASHFGEVTQKRPGEDSEIAAPLRRVPRRCPGSSTALSPLLTSSEAESVGVAHWTRRCSFLCQICQCLLC
jgi:hypothetical protein